MKIKTKVQVEKGYKSPNKIWKVNERKQKIDKFPRQRCKFVGKKDK